jgi:phage minor structural protein
LIHITDGKTDRILAVIDEDAFWGDKHTKSLKDMLETFDFTTFANERFSKYLAERNRVIIPDEDGEYIEFIIENTRKFHSVDGLFIEVYTSASYIELAKAKVIEPQTTPAWTAKQHVEMALSDTEWTMGTVDFSGTRTITIESYTNPYSYLKQVANEFGLELHFRVETDGNKVTRRYVDLVERVGGWNGREVEFGKDLIGIERKEDFSNVVTALVGIGPERDDGTRLQVFVEDKSALARWGRNGKHIVDVYEPNLSDSNMTLEQLRSLTESELSKRIHSVVEYTADVTDLGKVPGLEHEKFRFGDTIRIKDTAFTPPLYLESRVHTVERSIKRDGQKTVTLADYIEYTEEDVFAIYKRLKAEIAKKVSMTEVMEVTYTKTEVDDKDASVYQDSTYYADNVSETKKQEAIQQAIQEAEQQLNQTKTELETEISQLADEVAIKANKTDVYTKSETDGKISTINQQISQLDAELTVQAGQIASKVSKTDLQSLKNGVLKVRYIRDWLNGNSVNNYNHWVEIKVMSGTTNRASGKTPTSNYSLSNGSRVTDNDTNSNNYASGASGVSQYVQIDLGAVYEDIDYIQVWHYYADGRTYNGTKVEVSADGITWTTVFDSALSGIYKETADGLIVPINNRVLNSFNMRLSSAESTITQLADEIELKVDKDGVIAAINLSSEQARILAEKIMLDGYVEAKHIKSLNGLNVNNQFIVDANGNVQFAGNLQGATGTFTGTLSVLESDTNWDNKTIIHGNIYNEGKSKTTDNTYYFLVQNGSLSLGMRKTSTGEELNRIDIYSDQIILNKKGVPSVYFSNNNGNLNIQTDMIQIGTGAAAIDVKNNAARLKYNDLNYYYVTAGFASVYLDGAIRFRFDRNAEHNRIASGAAILKFLSSSAQIQSRTADDTAYGIFGAADFVVSSTRDTKTNIEPTVYGLDTILNTPVYDYKLKYEVETFGEENARTKTGLIWEEAPENLRGEGTLDLYSMVGIAWRAIQELAKEVNNIKASLGM